MSVDKNQKEIREFRIRLKNERDLAAERLVKLEKTQLEGDFSIEMARKISVLRYHIEVLDNRISGNFEATYRTDFEQEVPKKTKQC